MRQLDAYRQGRTDLVPAGFHLDRGVNLWVVWTLWTLPSLIIGIFIVLTVVPAMIAGFASLQPDANGVYRLSPGFYAATAGLNGLGSLSTLYGLVVTAFLPAIALATERGGIGGGLNPKLVWALASRQWAHTLVAAVCIWVGLFLGGLGILACCVGIVFTVPYGYAVLAAVLRYYEYTFEVPAPVSTGPPPPPPPASTPYGP
jgi:hypothetical protein